MVYTTDIETTFQEGHEEWYNYEKGEKVHNIFLNNAKWIIRDAQSYACGLTRNFDSCHKKDALPNQAIHFKVRAPSNADSGNI